MQISGRLIIAVVLSLAVAMSGGAWLYQYSYSRHAAAFWGAPAARLLVKSPQLALLELAPAGSGDKPTGDEPLERELIVGQPVAAEHDLSAKPGLIHLRHVFTQDSNFDWDAQRREPATGSRDWGYALRFTEDDQQLTVLLDRDFKLLGKLSPDGRQVDLLPCPRLATPLVRYLTDVGALHASTLPASTLAE